jgi:formylglycine-generating enzyme required for sulfatase activity
MAAFFDERSAMESMDHEQALALLGLSGTPQPDDIEAHYAQRRRLLERRWVTSHSDLEKRVLEAQMRELDAARDAALTEQARPAGLLPGASVDIALGTVLADRYAVRAKIGYGPRAAVYRALDLTWGKEVALKVFAPQLMLVPGAPRRLAEAIHPTFGFAHSGIVNSYAMVETGSHTLLAMELVDGRALAETAVVSGWANPKPASEILAVITQLCTALSYAEGKTLHLNLTPQNVVMTDGGVRITDFAMNQAVPVLAAARTLNASTAAYLAPEVVAMARSETPDARTVDARADQYSVAAIAYFLATGQAPETHRKPLGTLRPDLPGLLVAAIERALALAPEARFATHDEFVAAASQTARRAPLMLRRAAGGVVMVGLVILALATVRDVDRSAFGPLADWLPGAQESAATRLQAEALQSRSQTLRHTLNEAQRTLQRRMTDARIGLAGAEQIEAQRERGDAKTTDVAQARRMLTMLQGLSDLVTPGVFNNPEVLNAYNLAGLGDDHVARRKYTEAVGVYSAAETIMSAKLRDLRQAELMIEQQFGGLLPSLGTDRGALTADDQATSLRQSWLSAIDQRRQFAEHLDARLVLIPAGMFVMGDSVGNGAKSELPTRDVAVTAFKMGRDEVTQREYQACVDAGVCTAPQSTGPRGDDLPVVGVSWLDAQQYVDWLRMRTGEDYRLPSEAEWEYAARAGSSAAYAWGETPGRARASCLDCGSAFDGHGPAPVGSFAPNAFGVRDMTGNVWEWTGDCWYRDYTSALPTSAPRDGGGSCERRVLRGGSWDNAAWLARVSYRAFAPMSTRQDLYGFRIAKSVE